ncbi:MAG: hypothetical protein BWK80_19260 [Desulfobacteraceae bacterium IS3]|nr:MAG: hypothetical protein BWK80_19260 [Desulfobacteraceae bacterium IS3]
MKKNLLSTLIFSLLWMGISSAHALMIKTDPAIINPIKIGDTFKLNVDVEGVTDLGEFRFNFIYEPDVVTVTDIVFSNFLESTGRTISFETKNEEAPGILSFFASTIKGAAPGPGGNGTLLTITFQIKSLNNDFLNIEDAHLINTKGAELSASLPVGSEIIPALGNIDGKGAVTLSDAILGLRILAGIDTGTQTIMLKADVNNDNKIGIEEVVYILQYIAALR